MDRKLRRTSLLILIVLTLPLFGFYSAMGQRTQFLHAPSNELRTLTDAWRIMVPTAVLRNYIRFAPSSIFEYNPYQLCNDGEGGAYILWLNMTCWYDEDAGWIWYYPALYVQRINSTGYCQWAEPVKLFDHREIALASQTNSPLKICPDGTGGAIIAWADLKDGYPNLYQHIYIQRITKNGTKLWDTTYPNVVNVWGVSDPTTGPQIASDGAGGAFIVWDDSRGMTGKSDLYIQYFNSTGDHQWTYNGLPICTAPDNQRNPMVMSDGAGGAIVVWQDYRLSAWHIYIQHIDSTGTPQWSPWGLPICTTLNIPEQRTQIDTDGANGAIITWHTMSDIYAQRVDSMGALRWGSIGIKVCDATDIQKNPKISSDGAQGCFITWEDKRSGNYDIYVQHLNSTGGSLLKQNGMVICNATGDQSLPQIVSESSGGVVIT
ncbi:MAG: hypothetical protein ACFFD2_18210, partial [Promethearchaeota archaeon]